MEKLTVDLKAFQNKAIHVEILESAVRVKYKTLNNLKLSHNKLKEKLKTKRKYMQPQDKYTINY